MLLEVSPMGRRKTAGLEECIVGYSVVEMLAEVLQREAKVRVTGYLVPQMFAAEFSKVGMSG